LVGVIGLYAPIRPLAYTDKILARVFYGGGNLVRLGIQALTRIAVKRCRIMAQGFVALCFYVMQDLPHNIGYLWVRLGLAFEYLVKVAVESHGLIPPDDLIKKPHASKFCIG
jgi:hypothetical protein